MDMWNWLIDCYYEDSITLENLEKVMIDDSQAKTLWEDWAADSNDFIEWVRDEVKPLIAYIKKKEGKK
jgi:hypothetical protein